MDILIDKLLIGVKSSSEVHTELFEIIEVGKIDLV